MERLQTEVKIRSSVAVRVFNRTDFAGFVAVGREEVKNDFGVGYSTLSGRYGSATAAHGRFDWAMV